MLESSQIGTMSFGSIKLEIWIFQNQHGICKTVNQGEWEGEADTRDPRVRETVTGEMLVAGKAQRWRGLRWIQGHLRVPLIEATLLTYFTRALLDPKVLAVGNSGAAVLHGVTPANLGIGDAVEVADEQERLKTKL